MEIDWGLVKILASFGLILAFARWQMGSSRSSDD